MYVDWLTLYVYSLLHVYVYVWRRNRKVMRPCSQRHRGLKSLEKLQFSERQLQIFDSKISIQSIKDFDFEFSYCMCRKNNVKFAHTAHLSA